MNMKKIIFAVLFGLFSTSQLIHFAGVADAYTPSSTFAQNLDFEADCSVGPGENLTSENCGIIAYVVVAINLLSALAGIAIVASIMIAGYQYMTARDNAGQIEAARKRIIWALSALILFIFMYAGLNFIVPGGVL